MRKLLLIASLVFLAGCAVKVTPVISTPTVINTPEIGETVTAQIGDHLLQKGEVVEEEVLNVRSLVDGAFYDILPGSYPQLGYIGPDKLYSGSGVIKAALADPFVGISARPEEPGRVCVVTGFGARVCYEAVADTSMRASSRDASFQQTLVYNGRVGNRINVGYREFSNSLARPAFNNNVEYDLSISQTIGYKGALIEVIKADNASITYRVLSTFK